MFALFFGFPDITFSSSSLWVDDDDEKTVSSFLTFVFLVFFPASSPSSFPLRRRNRGMRLSLMNLCPFL